MDLKLLQATSQGLWRSSVALQREIYSRERHFEDWQKGANPDCFDLYDQKQSIRFLVCVEDLVVATCRVIFTGEDTLPALKLRPELEHLLSTNAYFEISSFCCSKKIRQELGLTGREASAAITLALITAATAFGQKHDSECSVMVLEPALLRYLESLSFPLHPVGEPVEYHGLRQVCFINAFEATPAILGQLRNRNISYETDDNFNYSLVA